MSDVMLPKDRASQLLVLCYHRVADTGGGAFNGFLPNVSADPREFERQMSLVARAYTPIGIERLVEWLDGGGELPERPALVTFDDGYLDNGEVALPIMRRHGIRPLIFLATDYIGNGRAFPWDVVAYCLATTRKTGGKLPLLGQATFADEASRVRLASEWMAACKEEPADERSEWLRQLAEATDVPVSSTDLPWKACMDWDLVRRLAARDVDFGGHTCSHPILSRMPPGEAAREIADCFDRLAVELGRPPLAFAYPNGSARDFRPDDERAVARAGFKIGFSLEPGPVGLASVRERPHAVPRIYIGRRDSGFRFWLKIKGAAVAMGRARQALRRGLSIAGRAGAR
ncbi:polysaccharide deacetylase family protein [Alsobacter sp. SYSU M60028]|uniref:Chitooligosaccharide deacetylase n=1 Tax=Alsobacter ponti TaxID=2962936 RepID=A0ABT1LCE7_9HYPH|nr:polysaccharide deacetylase family protein [Alsobacter ponti]MCP8938420.1 polysaccharide deacetylase family protein [Alsobacter ponti]